jgi:hypothetical protein
MYTSSKEKQAPILFNKGGRNYLNGNRVLQIVPQIHWNSKTVQADHGYVCRMAIFQT